jgi:hypothetical protein
LGRKKAGGNSSGLALLTFTMSDNPSKLTVPLLEEANYPAWCPAMEARLRQGMHFSVYNELFSFAKGTDKPLPSVASRIEDALARVKELCPAVMKLANGTRPYGLDDLDNELTLMEMLRVLPREELSDFTSLHICQKDLTRGDVEAAFQVEQSERDIHLGPLLSLSGNATLRTTAQPPRQNKPGVKCGFRRQCDVVHEDGHDHLYTILLPDEHRQVRADAGKAQLDEYLLEAAESLAAALLEAVEALE